MKRIYIGVIGFGTVGAGVVRTLTEKASLLEGKVGARIIVKKICDKDITSARSVRVDKSILTTDANEVLDDPQISIVLELIGGIHPAKEVIIKALQNGKHVVTANKALLAQEKEEIFKVAKDNNVEIYFEASVGGGIPVIKSLREGLVTNRIERLFGIINGTSNYILSKMTQEGLSFRAALLEAKEKDFAEKRPFLDISGMDSAHKLAILASLGFGVNVKLNDIYVEGIQGISWHDIRYAEEFGYTIKLLAIAKRVGSQLEVRVHPTLLPKEHLLSSVSGVYNAVYMYGDMVGEILLYGQGAGQLPAASAVISDIIDLVRNIEGQSPYSRLSIVYDSRIRKLRRMEEVETRYYIRFSAIDQPGVLAKISGILGRHRISIASVIQKERRKARVVPVVMMTHEARERSVRRALSQIDKLAAIKGKSVVIRIEKG